ncbi:MAG: dihydrodipicolinate synthase family protein [Alphaproteobacteria bacterium]|nr:dihydrodipicolinate synthase family protein [Alphaproteobacteria bacterium]
MTIRRSEAKDHARAHLRGIWAAALTPFRPDDLALDEAGFRRNLRHWIDDLKIDGFFVAGKQGEFFSMSLAERKRTFEIAVEETQRGGTKARTIMSCSDQNMDTVVELARHAEAVGADYVVVHAPVLHFVSDRDEVLYEYYKHVSEQVGIGIALWSHPDSGYLMSPELCARIAELPNVVAIKYSVPREMYARLTKLAGDRLIVSTASEDEWFDNIVELGWQVYLCSSPPYLLQTRHDLRMREYTDLAFKGEVARARAVRDSLEPVRKALKGTRPHAKPHAHQKHWQELLGQAGGAVRRPMLELTDAERAATRAAFESCGLRTSAAAKASAA